MEDIDLLALASSCVADEREADASGKERKSERVKEWKSERVKEWKSERVGERQSKRVEWRISQKKEGKFFAHKNYETCLLIFSRFWCFGLTSGKANGGNFQTTELFHRFYFVKNDHRWSEWTIFWILWDA